MPIKTRKTAQDVTAFINAVPDERKRQDSFRLVEIMSRITGEQPYMYGPSIVGFGNYHYKYESGHEGDAPVAGFSPRKTSLVVYLSPSFPQREALSRQLGKHKSAVTCFYIKKLEDVDVAVLEKMIAASVKQVRGKYGSNGQ